MFRMTPVAIAAAAASQERGSCKVPGVSSAEAVQAKGIREGRYGFWRARMQCVAAAAGREKRSVSSANCLDLSRLRALIDRDSPDLMGRGAGAVLSVSLVWAKGKACDAAFSCCLVSPLRWVKRQRRERGKELSGCARALVCVCASAYVAHSSCSGLSCFE
ncbi:uncharacterized protein LY79DRAFT_365987 [Colletotrichum navitas]|uniref:Uncharacterized protein n=1 Tax=Colletotrichum navitas TaxID=681940 RepID=A0AAD8V1P4_9PEZI|nr:uncharacterized protein LY79DRAFT_365987 [Colletotrichum navitas]KAK1574545.1 hypothetical protein LY79DRAFT_365987 [Colletotrichum navitas]